MKCTEEELSLTCFVICDRVNVGSWDHLEEENEESLASRDQRSVSGTWEALVLGGKSKPYNSISKFIFQL